MRSMKTLVRGCSLRVSSGLKDDRSGDLLDAGIKAPTLFLK